MVLWIADDRNATANLSNNVAFGNGLSRIIGAFSVYIGAYGPNQLLDRRLVEYCDEIDCAKGGDQFRALVFGNERTALTLESSGLGIGVDPNDEKIAERFRSLEISNMTYMQEIKTPICKNDGLARVSLCNDGGDEIGPV